MDLRRLHEQTGIATVYVTHDQVEAMTMADRILVMQGGEIHQIGAPRKVYEEPATLFAGRFFGSPPMNAITVRIRPHENGWAAHSPHHQETAVIAPPAAHAALWGMAAAEPVLSLGFRPECIRTGRAEGLVLTVSVTEVETLGPRSHVHARWGTDLLVFVVEHDRPVPERGTIVRLSIPLSSLHLFDAGGRRMPLPFAADRARPLSASLAATNG